LGGGFVHFTSKELGQSGEPRVLHDGGGKKRAGRSLHLGEQIRDPARFREKKLRAEQKEASRNWSGFYWERWQIKSSLSRGEK